MRPAAKQKHTQTHTRAQPWQSNTQKKCTTNLRTGVRPGVKTASGYLRLWVGNGERVCCSDVMRTGPRWVCVHSTRLFNFKYAGDRFEITHAVLPAGGQRGAKRRQRKINKRQKTLAYISSAPFPGAGCMNAWRWRGHGRDGDTE